jgi:hypothetical protein
MGFGSFIQRAGGAIASVGRSPLGNVLKGVPLLGTAISAVGIGASLYAGAKALGAGSGGSMPGLPALPGDGKGGMVPTGQGMGNRSIFRNDPNVIEQLKPWAIPIRDLRVVYRAPKGFVIRKDAKGDPYGIPKAMAKAYLGWKPAPKPPISVKDWKCLKRAGNVIDKFKTIEKEAIKIANFSGPRRKSASAQKIVMVEKGGKFVSQGKG